MKTVASILLVFLVLVLILPSFAMARSFTVDDALQTSSIHKVELDFERNRVIFEYEVKATDYAEGALPEGGQLSQHYKLYSASLDGGGAKPLFKQLDDAGYAFALGDPISPDRQWLAFTQSLGGITQVGIYNLDSKQVKIFDFKSDAPHIFWRNEEEIILIGTDGEEQFGQYRGTYHIPNARHQAEARERSFRNLAPTADVIGGGKYLSLSDRRVERHLIKLDIGSGETTVLTSGFFHGVVAFTEDRRYLAIHTLGSLAVPKPNHLRDSSQSIFNRGLTIVDLESGKSNVIGEGHDIPHELISWSPDSKLLLFYASSTEEIKSKGGLYLYDVRNEEQISLGVLGGASEGYYQEQGITINRRQMPHAYWLGDRIAYQDVETRHWNIIQRGREQVLKPVENVSLPSRPFAESQEALFYMIDGQVWSLGAAGEVVEISDASLPSLKRAGFRFDRSANNLNSLDITPLEYSVERFRCIITLSEAGAVQHTVHVPQTGVVLKAHGAQGVIYVQNTYGVGSTLMWAPEGNGKEAVQLLLYNTHLGDISAPPPPLALSHIGESGESLTSWLFLPSDSSKNESFPLIVIPYPGLIFSETPPTEGFWSIWGAVDHAPVDVQIYLGAGYAVLLPSIPLGSVPTDPMISTVPPVLSALDAAIDTGQVDASRLAVSGHSMGGYGALSISVQTDRFDAIIASAAPYANATSAYGSFSPSWRYDVLRAASHAIGASELGSLRLGGNPWEHTERFIRNSPIFHAENVTTPIMLIHGDLDFISPTQPEQMYTALMRQNKDVLYVRYMGEWHILASPKNIKDMWSRIFRFLKDNDVAPRAVLIKRGESFE